MTPHGPRAKTQNLRGSRRAPHWRVTVICSSCSAIAPALAPGTPVSRQMRQGVMVAAFGACAGAKRTRVKPNRGHRVRARRERTAARIHALSPQHSRPRRDRGCWPSSSHSARPPDAVTLRTPAGGAGRVRWAIGVNFQISLLIGPHSPAGVCGHARSCPASK